MELGRTQLAPTSRNVTFRLMSSLAPSNETVDCVRASAVIMFLVCLSPANVANAQLFEPENPAAPASMRAGQEELRGDHTLATRNSPSVCQVVRSTAAANGLPFEFFAQVIWQESRFRSDAVGPITRSGQRAQGIAQFMPKTAAERLLHDPFDPVEALPKSAEFLRELWAQFGNLGLAAAAYNAGPQRIRDWLAGKRTLPSETLTYVRIVTGHSVQEWARSEQVVLAITIPREMSCGETAKVVERPQSPLAVSRPKPIWIAQLIGDSSETNALTRFRQLQKKHQALLGIYEPVIIRTTLRARAEPIWTRIRVELDTRQAAESLCSRLEVVGEHCLVQRN
jgi:Transglycosylase SLT domain